MILNQFGKSSQSNMMGKNDLEKTTKCLTYLDNSYLHVWTMNNQTKLIT